MVRLFPRSLQGQMLLAVALALLVAQSLSAVLLYRAEQARNEFGAANALAFQLVAEPRVNYRASEERRGHGGPMRRWRILRLQESAQNPLKPGEGSHPRREKLLRDILTEQGVAIDELVVTTRAVRRDEFVRGRMTQSSAWRGDDDWRKGDLIVAGLKRQGESRWLVARLPVPRPEPRALNGVIMQTLVLYIVLVGGLALLLRRITRPLAALTTRVEQFAATRETEGQLEPSGPEDTRRLIAAHNQMEARISALLGEKDVMLGAIGHDLKTPLAALRVRIESVEDDAERAKMAATIEDISSSLDDILSLARVGRPSDALERTEISALVASVVEEFEDMGEPVELGETARMAGNVRPTWLRRALRNLVSNALRYGGNARVSVIRDGAMALIRIEDSGPGIPEDRIEDMLEPFVRGEVSRNRETGGAGLGLTLARAIAEQHGGSLTLANRSEGGLRAELRVPLAA